MEFLKDPFWVLCFFIGCKWYEISCNWLWLNSISYLLFSNENVTLIDKHINANFNSLCEWFIDNKFPIHLGEDKTKCILFKKRKKKYPVLNITRNKNKIKQYSVVEYFGYLLDENMSGESKKQHKKINRKTKFLYRQNRYLSYHLKRMLYNYLIQPHYDFACCAWYPNLPMPLKNKLQTAQNASISFCHRMERRSHIELNHFEKINSLPVMNRVDQCIAVTAYNLKITSLLYICQIYIL